MSRPDPMPVSVHTSNDAVLVTVSGEVDMATSPGLWDAAERAIGVAEGRAVVIDLNGVSFFDSHGLASLDRAADAARSRNVPLRVVAAAGHPARRVLELTGMDKVLAVYDDVVDAC